MIESKRAVVLGLVGLDSVHNIYSELHPVYGIAIEMEEKETTENGVPVVDSKWIIFARDEGNEGGCSFKPHPLYGPDHKPLETLKLLIPPPQGRDVTGAGFLDGTSFYSNNGTEPDAAYYDSLFPPDGGVPYARNNKGVLLTFDLKGCREGAPSPCAPLIEGEINLRWKVTPATAAERLSRVPRFDACIEPEGYEEEQKLQRKPTPRQASQLFQLLLKARAEGLTMWPVARAYQGTVPNAGPRGACASVLTTVRQPGSERFSRFSFPGGPLADIIDILGRP